MTYVVISCEDSDVVAAFDNEHEADLFADGANIAAGDGSFVVALVPELYQHRDY